MFFMVGLILIILVIEVDIEIIQNLLRQANEKKIINNKKTIKFYNDLMTDKK